MTTSAVKPMAFKSESTMTTTLKAKTDKGYTTSMQMSMPNVPTMPAQETTIPWPTTNGPDASNDFKPTLLGTEDVSVGGEKLSCKHWSMVTDGGGVTTNVETWIYKGTLVIRMISKNENMTTAIEATRIDRK